MAYSNPPRWAHGDTTVSAARLNVLSDDLDALHEALTGDNPAVVASAGVPTTFINAYRWLHYMTIVSVSAQITGAGEAVSLPESLTTMATYDLSGIAWLTPGMAYTVTGCQYAAEDREG